MMEFDDRAAQLRDWTARVLKERHDPATLRWDMEPLTGDASFRRYFRLTLHSETLSYMLMDAPPDREDCRPFLQIADLLRDHGVPAPRISAVDLDQGFMMLEDFGDSLYLPALTAARRQGDEQQVDRLYGAALDCLARIQAVPAETLAPYDRALLHREMALFDEWFCAGLLGRAPDGQGRSLLDTLYRHLEDRALAQPQVFVHRDYHSRNLMIRGAEALPGVIDFQDAVRGPVTYDLVSLLRDCYIVWPQAWVRERALAYLRELQAAGRCIDYAEADFLQDFDLMGLQRHLKVLGIFSRLYLRDGKARYLSDLPVVMDYVLEVTRRHAALQPFHDWFAAQCLPLARQRLESLIT